jgi:poly(3-hydroxyalkanoate) synthetase
MLPSIVKGARIWTFDYNSNYSHHAQTVRIDGVAATLVSSIQDRCDDFKSRKIVFIGSCFGGVVVAKVRMFNIDFILRASLRILPMNAHGLNNRHS